MAAPIVVSTSKEVADSFSDSGFTPSNIADIVAGDLLIHFGVCKENAAGDVPIYPAGWTSLVDVTPVSGQRFYVGYKIAAGNAEAATLTFGNPTVHNVAHWSQFVIVSGITGDPLSTGGTHAAGVTGDDNTNPLSLATVAYLTDWLVLSFGMGSSLINPLTLTAHPTGFTTVDTASNGSVSVIGGVARVEKLTALADGDTSGLSYSCDNSTSPFFHFITYTLAIGAAPGGGGSGLPADNGASAYYY
jgi:hypothetical protein